MEVAARLVVLVVAVVALTAAMILPVGAPTISIISGLFGAVLPVLLIYAVIVSSYEC